MKVRIKIRVKVIVCTQVEIGFGHVPGTGTPSISNGLVLSVLFRFWVAYVLGIHPFRGLCRQSNSRLLLG